MGIERTKRKERAVSMGCIGHRRERAEVIDPVEVGCLEWDVEPTEEEVDGVRVTGTKGGREGPTDPGRCGGRPEFGVLSKIRNKRLSSSGRVRVFFCVGIERERGKGREGEGWRGLFGRRGGGDGSVWLIERQKKEDAREQRPSSKMSSNSKTTISLPSTNTTLMHTEIGWSERAKKERERKRTRVWKACGPHVMQSNVPLHKLGKLNRITCYCS